MVSQAEREEKILKLLDRIKKTPDGADFIEYLKDISLRNYSVFKKCHPETDELHKGYAIAIDSLIESFENCGNKLAAIELSKKPDPDEDDDGNLANAHG